MSYPYTKIENPAIEVILDRLSELTTFEFGIKVSIFQDSFNKNFLYFNGFLMA